MGTAPTTEQCVQSIDAAIARLRQFSQWDALKTWRRWDGELPPEKACNPAVWANWQAVELSDRGYIEWPQGRQTLWLGQVFQMHSALFQYPLQGSVVRLALRWWAESAEIYINGTLVQEGDLFDCFGRVVLTESLVPDATIAVAIRLISPGHDGGALVQSLGLYETPCSTDGTAQRPDPGMVASELEILKIYLSAFQPDALPKIVDALQDIAWPDQSSSSAFDADLRQLQLALQPWSDWLKQRRINWVGHAHLDLAWLWPVAETWEAAERTFRSALQLQADFSELKFCHSSPALYQWIEQHRPELFAQIQARVAEGRWEVAAGLWVEPELNLISGESIVRQVLYGQRYTQERFGQISRVAWLPDSFGFCAQLPQIFKQGGIDYFLTQKLCWNDTTQFPHEAFWWQAPDGTRIFSIMTPPIGEAVDPVKMSRHAQEWEAKTGYTESLWLPGVGDHGGGPTRDMLEVGRRWQQSSLCPQLVSDTMTEFSDRVSANLPDAPVWADELYLEFHRGCYTSHADQKRYNRRCEHWLTEAELFSAIATLLANTPYPKTELETAWKQVLFNQFHDILPGSSIPEVFVDANQEWEQAQQAALDIRKQALMAIANQIRLPEPPVSNAVAIVVFNSLNWERSEVVSWPAANYGVILDGNGQTVAAQYNFVTHTLSFWANEIPSIGYQVFWYVPTAMPTPTPAPQEWVLDNGYLRVEICEQTGNIASIWDYAAQRHVLSEPGNVLQFFQDQGQYWDAWNIDPNYAQHLLEPATLVSIARMNVSDGEVEQGIEVVRQWRNSTFTQTYRLPRNASVLNIETQVDWQETHVLVKTAFPLSVTAPSATYESPCAVIARPTLPNPQPLTDHEKAKWEVPALHWADLTEVDGSYGVSLLNDCKYGYDAQPSCLRLTLLRSPRWPDPECDRGMHQFTYALYPHRGDWQTAQTVRRGYELNRPLLCLELSNPSAMAGQLDLAHSFLSHFPDHAVLMAMKQSESSPQEWIVRLHEAHGKAGTLSLHTTLPITPQSETDGLEQPTGPIDSALGPWQVRSQAWSGQSSGA